MSADSEDGDDVCMCGEALKNHGVAAGHSPVSRNDYYANHWKRERYRHQRVPTLEKDIRELGRLVKMLWLVIVTDMKKGMVRMWRWMKW